MKGRYLIGSYFLANWNLYIGFNASAELSRFISVRSKRGLIKIWVAYCAAGSFHIAGRAGPELFVIKSNRGLVWTEIAGSRLFAVGGVGQALE